MRAIVEALEHRGRNQLARILQRHGAETLGTWARSLHAHRPRLPFEPALADAFGAEFARCGWPPVLIAAALADLEARRVLQTATHLTAAEGPTFLAVHAVATAGLPPAAPYLVGAFSGVPFSNPAWSGCLNVSARHPLEALIDPAAPIFTRLARDARNSARDRPDFERRVSLVPARARDGLVYRAPVPGRMREVIAALAPALAVLSPGTPDESFDAWALGFCERTARAVLGREEIFYFDLNRVLATYLARALADSRHPLARLLFDPDLRARVVAALGPAMPWFCVQRERHARWRVIGLAVAGDRLEGSGVGLELTPAAVVAGLEQGWLCPGVPACFAALVFINGFCCLGSFEQIEYLERFRAAFDALGWPEPGVATQCKIDGLCTGRCLAADGQPVWPLDVVLGTGWRPDPERSLAEWTAPLLARLLGGKESADQAGTQSSYSSSS